MEFFVPMLVSTSEASVKQLDRFLHSLIAQFRGIIRIANVQPGQISCCSAAVQHSVLLRLRLGAASLHQKQTTQRYKSIIGEFAKTLLRLLECNMMWTDEVGENVFSRIVLTMDLLIPKPMKTSKEFQAEMRVRRQW